MTCLVLFLALGHSPDRAKITRRNYDDFFSDATCDCVFFSYTQKYRLPKLLYAESAADAPVLSGEQDESRRTRPHCHIETALGAGYVDFLKMIRPLAYSSGTRFDGELSPTWGRLMERLFSPPPPSEDDHESETSSPAEQASRPYDALFLILDDVRLRSFDVHKILDLFRSERNLMAVSPALGEGNWHPVMGRHPPAPPEDAKLPGQGPEKDHDLRYTRFLEFQAIAVQPKFWACVWTLLEPWLNESGWGHDRWMWSFCRGQLPRAQYLADGAVLYSRDVTKAHTVFMDYFFNQTIVTRAEFAMGREQAGLSASDRFHVGCTVHVTVCLTKTEIQDSGQKVGSNVGREVVVGSCHLPVRGFFLRFEQRLRDPKQREVLEGGVHPEMPRCSGVDLRSSVQAEDAVYLPPDVDLAEDKKFPRLGVVDGMLADHLSGGNV